MKLIKDKTFKDLTTFHIGGGIRYLVEVTSAKEISEAVQFAKQNKLPIFIIGGGSDVLIGDKDFDGLVIKFAGDGVQINDEVVTAEAGLSWDKLVEKTVEENLQGIECLSGIPGSVGAAPIQNIGAYGQELKDTFVSLTAFDIDKGKLVEMNHEDCGFGYRESIFKRPEFWQKFCIVDITLKLYEGEKPDVKYDSLKNYLAERNITTPTLGEVREAVKAIRAGKFEDPKKVGNAGSFFKNPIINIESANKLKERFPDIVLRDQGNGSFKGSAGWFIEKAGWKGKTYKNAGVSPMHALILINPEGKAKASDIMELSDKIIKDVFEKFGVKLEREVQLINF